MECGSEASAPLKLRFSTPEAWRTASSPVGRAGELWSAEAKLPPDAEADASALQIGSRAAPLAYIVGEGLGVGAKEDVPYGRASRFPLRSEG